MASAGSLIFELAADVSRLRQDMAKAQTTIQASLDSIAKSSAANAVMMGAQWAKSFAQGIGQGLKQAIDAADDMGKLSERVGITTEELSGLAKAAEYAGVNTDTLATGFKGLNKVMVDGADEAGATAQALNAIGLSYDDIKSKNPKEQMMAISDAFSKAADGAGKANVATQLFGKSGQELIPFLNQGSEAIQQQIGVLQEWGAVIGDDTAQAAADFNDRLTDLQNISEGAMMTLAKDLLPTLTTLVEVFKESSQEGGLVNIAISALGEVVKGVAADFLALSSAVSGSVKWLARVDGALTKFVTTGQSWKETTAQIGDANNDLRQGLEKTDAQIGQIYNSGVTDEGKALAAAFAQAGKDAEAAGKKQIQYAGAVSKTAGAHKAAKKEVDEYKKIMDGLDATYRSLIADGDALKALVLDPAFQKLNKQQQENLIEAEKRNEQLKKIREDQKKESEDTIEMQKLADEAYKNSIVSVQDWADEQKRALDPMIAYREELDKLAKALAMQAVTPEQATEIAKRLEEGYKKAADSIDPMTHKMDELKQAVLGFGKQAGDALVDFVFATDKASVSFSEMVSTMLKEIAKLLVYQNIIEPMFSKIGALGSTGGAGIFGALFGNRMAGGPVGAGQLYSVNESPLRGEYFVANTPGSIRTSEQMGSAGAVNVQVNVYRGGETTDNVTADTAQGVDLGKRISAVVRQVIAQEKRTGGLLA